VERYRVTLFKYHHHHPSLLLDFKFYTEVRWLTIAEMMKIVFYLKEEMQLFFASKSKNNEGGYH
jgi:hypothetical protein